jgi:hypothetical protein
MVESNISRRSWRRWVNVMAALQHRPVEESAFVRNLKIVVFDS